MPKPTEFLLKVPAPTAAATAAGAAVGAGNGVAAAALPGPRPQPRLFFRRHGNHGTISSKEFGSEFKISVRCVAGDLQKPAMSCNIHPGVYWSPRAGLWTANARFLDGVIVSERVSPRSKHFRTIFEGALENQSEQIHTLLYGSDFHPCQCPRGPPVRGPAP